MNQHPKTIARLKIEKEVFDVEDSVADTAKWLSLLTSLVSRIYLIVPEEQKATLSANDRQLIEYAFSKFATTTTLADAELRDNPIGFINKVLDRQAAVKLIVRK